MKVMTESYFLKMIQQLRQHEQVVLYERILSVSEAEASLVAEYLKKDYERESLHYPDGSPAYNASAALWAAQTVYVAAQLILYRESNPDELQNLFPDYPYETDAGAILSADLCLRFLPEMIRHLKVIASDDKLINILAALLQRWHYSGITWPELNHENLNFSIIAGNKALHQLYSERIIHYTNTTLSAHPVLNDAISSQLGIYGQELWRDFKRTLPE